MQKESLDLITNYLHENSDRFVNELAEFVAIPSISTDPNVKPAMVRAANWVADKLRALSFERVEVFPTAGAPIVYAENMEAGAEKPTVLVYGHYDVQPAEPLGLWDSLPFEPVVRDDQLYGRGASDMKGQIVAILAAIEGIQQAGGLPVNLKFLVEGEEEIGSPNIEEFIIQNQKLLVSDFALNPDAGMIGEQTPTITYGLRGLSYFELWLTGPDHDLHSGLYGGAVENPATVLCELIAGMHDSDDRITLPHFYERVRDLSDQERKELAALPTDTAEIMSQSGVNALTGETGFTALERIMARPTLEVNGLLSGFTGEGSKTVLPARAMAKISCRLVPDQDPYEVKEQMLQYLEEKAPSTVRWELTMHSGGYPAITNIDHPAVRSMSKALEDVWGVRPLYRREGGSIPVVAQMQQHLKIESVLTGFSLPEDNLHAPNEKLSLPTFQRGIEAVARFLCYVGE